MQQSCPSCGKTLRLPDTVPAGAKVRCPACQTVFSVGEPPTNVIASSAAAVPPRAPEPVDSPPERSERDDRPERPARPWQRGRDRDYDEDDRRRRDYDRDDRRPRRRMDEDDDADLEDAREAARGPARRGSIWMVVAGFFAILTAAINMGSTFAVPDGPGGRNFRNPDEAAGFFVGVGCVFLVFAVFVVFIFVGASQLAKLGSKGLVITGCVMAFLFTLIFSFGVCANGIGLFAPIPGNLKPMLLLCLINSGLGLTFNLIGGIMGLVGIANRDASRYYRLKNRW